MVIWAAIVGALLGWVMADFEQWAMVPGGIVGLLAGLGLRAGVRGEIAAATAELRGEIAALRAAAGAAPVEVVAAAPVVAAEVAVVDVPAPAPPFPHAFATPTPPEEPGWLTVRVATVFAMARAWLFGGNTIVRLGLVILFVGLSFLASYAASAGLFPIELRLALVGAFGIGLLAIGYRTRASRADFALALQGGGVATIYLTLFGAARFYDLLPPGAAFATMVVVCALACALALLQRSQALAVTAFAGGFAVPLLVGGDGGNALGLFGYGTILNLAILFIARSQGWRVLNLVGFFATFGIAALWGASSYTPDRFAVAQGFLIASVLIYVATAMLQTRASPGRGGHVVDTTLLFGPALAGFALEVALVGEQPFSSAFAAIGFGALYLGVAAWSMRRNRAGLRVMNEAMLAIGIGFVTMAVPLALGARWTSAAWALEGAGAFWVGARQARWVPRAFGMALLAVASIVYLATIDTVSAVPLGNSAFVGAMLVALGWLAIAWIARVPIAAGDTRLGIAYARGEAALGAPAFLTGFGFWWIAWLTEAMRARPPVEAVLPAVPVFDGGVQVLLAMLAWLASAAAFQALARQRAWPVAAWPARVGVAAPAVGFVGAMARGDHVLSTPHWALWIVAIALHAWMLRHVDREEGAAARTLASAGHVGGVWLAVAMLADMLWLGIDRAALWSTAWSEVTLLAGSVAVLAALALWAGPAMREGAARWPLDTHATHYGWVAAVPVAGATYGGAMLVALFSSGDADPLPFVPLVNPVDLIVLLAIGVLLLWRRAVLAAQPAALAGRGVLVAIAALVFVAVNGAWLRAAHHLAGVAWRADALLGDSLVETGLAILWTLIALAAMTVAYRQARRGVWIAGAVLLGATVAKLLLVDLNTASGGARIVAFIAVGMLMLLVGYLAPLPPKTEGATA